MNIYSKNSKKIKIVRNMLEYLIYVSKHTDKNTPLKKIYPFLKEMYEIVESLSL